MADGNVLPVDFKYSQDYDKVMKQVTTYFGDISLYVIL